MIYIEIRIGRGGYGFCVHRLLRSNFTPEIAQPTFQRRINVVSTLWINVEITLIRHWK